MNASVGVDTGRIAEALDWRARRIAFGDRVERAIDEELPYYAQIDRAQVVMLVERGVLPRGHGRRVLDAIRTLAEQDYAPLRGRPAPRGLYLLYEQWLAETLGEEVGGAVHIGRSRNDLSATVLRLRLRSRHVRVVREGLRLLDVLARCAEQYAGVTMPIYTHYQAALPITYGHYLAGVALALARDLQGLDDAVRDMDRSPLGAGAAGGTSVPIDVERTAALLGFTGSVLHSVDAVASRDLVLRLLGAAAILGVTVSRVAADLQVWSTAEFDLIRFPDRLVGSSSMMPQKRNAFLLEHVKGRSAALLGAFTTAVVAMHGTPFSNSVAVGTEGAQALWSALADLTDTLVLTRLSVAGAEPQPDSMRRRAIDGFCSATELANRLVLETGMSFRRAHHRVGEVVRDASERHAPLASAAGALLREHGLPDETAWLAPEAVAGAARYGGGPAAPSLARVLSELRQRASATRRALGERSRTWRAGRRALDAAAAAVTAPDEHRQPIARP